MIYQTVHFFLWEVAISTKKCTRRCVKIEMYIETLPHALLLTWGTSTASLHLHFLHFSPNWHLKKGKKRHLMKCLTQVEVGVESQRAVLYVKGEGVDIEVTGAENSGWFSIIHHPIAIQVHIRDKGGCVFIHTAKGEVSRGVMSVSRLCNMMHSSFNLRDFWTAAWKQRKQIVLFYFIFFLFPERWINTLLLFLWDLLTIRKNIAQVRLNSQFIDYNIWHPKFVSGKGNLAAAALDWVPTDKLVLPPLK